MASVDRRSDKTIEKIMAGTMRALSRQGTYKLSVSDICRASGVARGTVYRYFNSKDDILSALGQHFEDGLVAALSEAIDENPDPSQRVQVVLDAIASYREARAEFSQILEVAPEFALDFMRDTFPALVDAVTEALGPAVNESPLVVSGALTPRQLGDLFLRAMISMMFLPGGRAAQVPAAIAALYTVATEAESAGKKKQRPRRRAPVSKAC